jgi:hypothetical protein
VASAAAIPRTVNDGEHGDFVRRLVHQIDNDVWGLHEFARSLDQPGPTDVREARNCKPADTGENATDQFGRCTRIVFEIQSRMSSRSAAAASRTTTFIRQGDGAADP